MKCFFLGAVCMYHIFRKLKLPACVRRTLIHTCTLLVDRRRMENWLFLEKMCRHLCLAAAALCSTHTHRREIVCATDVIIISACVSKSQAFLGRFPIHGRQGALQPDILCFCLFWFNFYENLVDFWENVCSLIPQRQPSSCRKQPSSDLKVNAIQDLILLSNFSGLFALR